MSNQYFTPSIEDIRVGYECETMPVHMHEPDDTLWRKCLSLTAHDIKEIEDQWLDIRVPYLTKEQIEAEGWTSQGSKDYFLFGYDVHQNFHMAFEKGDYVIQGRALFGSHHHLKIFDRSDQEGAMCIFEGECKDINTFRYITKLLGIK